MADIKQRISLDGADDVASKLKRIGDTGQDAFRKLKEYSGPAGESVGKFADHSEGVESAREAGEKLREVFHTLHPVLEQTGLELGNFGAFARLAGAGMVPLGAAITGALLVALAKLGEETQKSKARLKALGDDTGFDKLSERAKKLGVSVDSLQPGYEKFIAQQQRATAQNRQVVYAPNFQPGQGEDAAAGVSVINGGRNLTVPSRETFGKFDDALLQELRIDTKDAEEARRIADEFKTNLANNGLTGDIVRSLQESSPHAANFISRSLNERLGQGFPNPNVLAEYLDRHTGVGTPPPGLTDEQRKAYYANHPAIGGIGANDLISDVAKHAGEAEKEAEAARGVTEAFEGLKASTGRFAESLSGDHLSLTGALDGISHALDKGSEEIEHAKGASAEGSRIGANIGRHLPILGGETIGRSAGGFEGEILGIYRNLLGEGADKLNQTTIGGFLSKAITNPAAIPGNTPEPLPEKFEPPFTPEQLQQTFPKLGNGAVPDQTLGGWLIQPPAQQAAPDASGDKPATTLQQIGSAIVSAITALANKANPDNLKLTGPDAQDQIGIRGATGGLATHTGFRFDNGGHIRGPGTSTSDSIPMWGSDGEYMIKESSVRKVGVPFLDWLNAGHFADGGSVLGSVLGTILGGGAHHVTYDPETGGAYVDGVLRRPGDPVLNDPIIKAAIERSKADANQDEHKRRKPHSDFVGRFGHDDNADTYVAGGGLIGHFAGGGFVGHFAGGGAAFDPADHLYSPVSGRSIDVSSGLSGGGSPWDNVQHLGSMDLRSDHGDARIIGPQDALKQISRAARDRANVRTGPSPSWRGS